MAHLHIASLFLLITMTICAPGPVAGSYPYDYVPASSSPYPTATLHDLCGLLPRRPPGLPPYPPRPVEPCSVMGCENEPAPVCYEHAAPACEQGRCLFTPSYFGKRCDDGNEATDDDVCDGNGKCAGIVFNCPKDIVVTPEYDDTVAVTWREPTPRYHGLPFNLHRSHAPGHVREQEKKRMKERK